MSAPDWSAGIYGKVRASTLTQRNALLLTKAFLQVHLDWHTARYALLLKGHVNAYRGLTGRLSGLYVLDAQPNAGIALSVASGDSAARHHALWTGLGVHHIETYAETNPYAESPRGLVLALVDGTHGELELRMWNLASIVNLVKWRVYSAVRRYQICSRRNEALTFIATVDLGCPLARARIAGSFFRTRADQICFRRQITHFARKFLDKREAVVIVVYAPNHPGCSSSHTVPTERHLADSSRKRAAVPLSALTECEKCSRVGARIRPLRIPENAAIEYESPLSAQSESAAQRFRDESPRAAPRMGDRVRRFARSEKRWLDPVFSTVPPTSTITEEEERVPRLGGQSGRL